MSTLNSVESLRKVLEDEKTAHGLANAKKNAILGKLNQEKKMRIGAEFERDALRAMMATVENEKKVVLLGMKAIAEAKMDALRGRLLREWIDEHRQAMIDMSIPPPDWDSFSY
ncbi:hypothetical protein LWI29_004447 [Acer saccharum]|uniref:Uncharacterized protein n=1 Tax=Acer saccharum TaxID=4024 RepID=A0AA39SCJ9_ACESA|nr:hypothetical protein LWI29_004447 [Acer saccharum]